MKLPSAMLGCFFFYCGSAFGSQPDPSKLTYVTFDLPGKRLAIPVPSARTSPDVAGVMPATRTKLLDSDLELSEPLVLYQQMWDWRRLWTVKGSILLTVSISPSPGFSPLCSDFPNGYLETKEQELVGLGGRREFLPKYQVLDYSMKLNGADGYLIERASDYDFLKKTFVVNGSRTVIVPVSSQAFLQVEVDLVGGAVGGAWFEGAKSLRDKIVRDMRFEGEWPKVTHCDRH